MLARARGVRFRVTAIATSAAAAVLVVASFALLSIQDLSLRDAIDETLARRGADLADLARTGSAPETLAGGDDDSFAQVVDGRGTVLASSPNLAGRAPIAIAPSGGRRALRTVEGLPVDDDAFRVLSMTVDGSDGPVTVHVGLAVDDRRDVVGATAKALLAAVPVALFGLAALVWWLVGRTLRPVEAIRAEVAAIGARDLRRRVPTPPSGDEIASLAGTMNAMLDRIERATERERRFLADASHELRTPLARMRTEIEVDLAHPDSAEHIARLRSILDDVVAMQHLVEDLLHLARSDAGSISRRRELVDLDDVVTSVARTIRSDGRLSVDTSAVDPVQVEADPDELVRAIGNVAENAARHAASRVDFSVTLANGTAMIAIRDDGPGLREEEREHVFERFARLDGARTRQTGGTGLGLAIARDIVSHHGGTIHVEPKDRRGACFVIRLPVRETASGP